MERQERTESSDEGEIENEEAPSDEFLSDEEPTEESPLEAEESDRSAPRRRRRRRRRPGERGPRRELPAESSLLKSSLTESESEAPFAAASPYQASSDDEDEEEDDEAAEAEGEEVEGEGDEESPRVYRNVPTWEEAIGFLLHRQPGDSHSREGHSGGSAITGVAADVVPIAVNGSTTDGPCAAPHNLSIFTAIWRRLFVRSLREPPCNTARAAW